MAVITRIDARSERNSSIQLQSLDGEILAIIEVVPASHVEVPKLRNEANLRIHTSGSVRIIKGNGAVLRKK